jgi:hypothetical protein
MEVSMNATFRLLIAAVPIALALAACASSSTQSQGAKGVTSMQAPNRCLQLESSCARDDDCCSLSCMNGVCERREP